MLEFMVMMCVMCMFMIMLTITFMTIAVKIISMTIPWYFKTFEKWLRGEQR
jgi:hypothetical protein